MARIVIDLPEHFAFRTELPIYIQHINYGNHLDNGALLTLVSEARVRFLQSLGNSELNVEGLGIVVTDAAIQYKSEAFHGEVLVMDSTPAEFGKYGFDLLWKATEKTTGREVARGKTGIVFFDHATRRIAPTPAGFVGRLTSS